MGITELLVAFGAGIFIIFFAEGLLEMLGYVVFGIATLGLVKLQGAEHNGLKFPWHGFARSAEGKVVVESKVASLLGLLLFAAICAGVLYWRVHAN